MASCTPFSKHTPHSNRLLQLVISLSICLPLAFLTSTTHAQAPKANKKTSANNAPAKATQEPVTLNFNNAEIEAVAKTLATLSGHNVVVDPRVKGTITLTSTVPVAPSQALRLFAAQLRTQSFALVESAGLYLVVPEADAKLQSGGVNAGSVPVSNGQIVTQIFQLNHESANNLVPILRPLISPNNTVNVNPGTNALVITDYADNLQRLLLFTAGTHTAVALNASIQVHGHRRVGHITRGLFATQCTQCRSHGDTHARSPVTQLTMLTNSAAIASTCGDGGCAG